MPPDVKSGTIAGPWDVDILASRVCCEGVAIGFWTLRSDAEAGAICDLQP
jgi:hypothetical protein